VRLEPDEGKLSRPVLRGPGRSNPARLPDWLEQRGGETQLKELGILLLGWLLGTLSPHLSERIQRGYRRDELVEALLTEARGVQFRTALAAWRLRQHLLKVDSEFVRWLQPILDAYEGPDKDPNAIEAFRKLLERTDAQLKAIDGALRRPGVSPRLVAFATPFLTSQVAAISICSLDFQRRILDLSNQLSLYNEEVRQTMDMLDKTFDPGIIDANREAVLANLEKGYEKLARRTEGIARQVTELINAYPRKKRWFAS